MSKASREEARKHFNTKRRVEGTETVEEGGYVFSRKKPKYRRDDSTPTFQELEAPHAHLSFEEQTGVPDLVVQSVLHEDAGGGYMRPVPYEENCRSLRFFTDVRYVMRKRREAFAGQEIVEVMGPPDFHALQLLRDSIAQVQGQMHKLWKTLRLRGEGEAVGCLTAAHVELESVDGRIKQEQQESTSHTNP